MARHAALIARVARIERAKRPRFLPKLAFALFPEECPLDAIQGFRSPEGMEVAREAGEGLSALLARAWQRDGMGPSLFAIYPPEAEPSADDAPEAGPTLIQSGSHLAGVGRRATREELERWGVMAVPAERLIDLPSN